MIEFWKKLSLTYPGIFFICYLQVILVTINMYQIAHQQFIGMFIIGFLISFLWTFNVSAIVFGTIKQRIVYGLGGAFGCISGGFLSDLIYT